MLKHFFVGDTGIMAVYSTKRAKAVSISSHEGTTEILYRTKKGNWFIYESIPILRSKQIEPISKDEALVWLADNGKIELAIKYGLNKYTEA